MAISMLDEVKCPICIETLKKPIRVLRCGHNLCQSCLVDLYQNASQRKCPICRKVIQLDQNGAESLPRNLVVENVIDRLSVAENEETAGSTVNVQPTAPQPLSDEEIIQYKVLADSLMLDKNFQNASMILHYLTNELEGISKLQPIIKRAKCLLEIEKMEEAKTLCFEIFSIIDLKVYEEISSAEIYDGCDEELKEVVQKLIENGDCGIAVQLVQFLFIIVKCSYESEVKLVKLRNLGALVEQVAVKMNGNYKYTKQSSNAIVVFGRVLKNLIVSNKGITRQFLDQLQLLENIYQEMLTTNVNDIKKKSLSVAWILKNIEYCSHNVDSSKNTQKSIEIDKQAITLLETVLGATSSEHKLLALLYKELGWALKCSGRTDEAKKALKKAVQLHSTATDWGNNDEKSNSLSTTKGYLQEIDKTYIGAS